MGKFRSVEVSARATSRSSPNGVTSAVRGFAVLFFLFRMIGVCLFRTDRAFPGCLRRTRKEIEA